MVKTFLYGGTLGELSINRVFYKNKRAIGFCDQTPKT